MILLHFSCACDLEVAAGLVTKSCLTLATPWTLALQAPLSMGFSRQEYWSGLPFPSPGAFLTQEWNLGPALEADSLPTELQSTSVVPVWLKFCILVAVVSVFPTLHSVMSYG